MTEDAAWGTPKTQKRSGGLFAAEVFRIHYDWEEFRLEGGIPACP